MDRHLLFPLSFAILMLAACMPNYALGQQFDAPYYKLLERNKQKCWFWNEPTDTSIPICRFGPADLGRLVSS